MAITAEQKKQAIILLLLVGVLAIVFFVADPFKLFKKKPTPKTNPAATAAQPGVKTTNAATPKTPVKPKASTGKKETKVIDVMSLTDIEKKPFLELLPTTTVFSSAYPYKFDIFKFVGQDKKIEKWPEIDSISSRRTGRTISFKNVSQGRKFREGDEFLFEGTSFRILRIKVNSVVLLNIDSGDKKEIKRR